MPQVCRVCASEHRDAIEDAFLAGVAKRRIATQFGIGEKSVRHHVRECLPALVVLARDAERAARADSLLDRIEALQSRIEVFLERVESTENYGAILGGFREMRSNLELIGEVTKQLDRTPTLNLHLNPQWIELKTVIVEALGEYPGARAAVVRAIQKREERRELEAGNGQHG